MPESRTPDLLFPTEGQRYFVPPVVGAMTLFLLTRRSKNNETSASSRLARIALRSGSALARRLLSVSALFSPCAPPVPFSPLDTRRLLTREHSHWESDELEQRSVRGPMLWAGE